VRDFAPRLEIGNKPWKDYERARQALTDAMRALEFDAGKKSRRR
jgi:hypothetical protein